MLAVAVVVRLRHIRLSFALELVMGELKVESRISKVTVFQSGAQITRVAELPKLVEQDLRLVGLPLSLEDSTVRCRVLAPAESGDDKESEAPVSSEFRVALDAPGLLQQKLRPEAQELKSMRLEIKQLRSRALVLSDALGFQMKVGPRATGKEGQPPIGPPLDARLALLEFFDNHYHSLYDESRAVQEKIEATERRLDELEAAEQRASSVGRANENQLSKCVLVSILGGESRSDLQLELTYFVPGARWAPAYGLRIREGLESAELTMRALVSQRSGEDWTGVELTLSTAELQRWAEVPELASKRIGRRQPKAPKRGWRPPPAGSEELYRDYDNSFGTVGHPLTIGVAGAAEPILFGSSGSRGDEDYEDDDVEEVYANYSAFDEEEHTAELLEADIAPPTQASSIASKMAPAAAPSPSRRRAKMSKEMSMPPEAGRWEEAGLGGGGAVANSLEAPLRIENSDNPHDALLHYARMRLCGAGNQERGLLQLTTSANVYVECLEDQGIKVDEEIRDRLLLQAELARESALEIAELPNDHSLAWAEDYDYAYSAQSSLDLLSDGQFHSVPVMASEASCTSMHVVVPRESADVFRTLKMKNCFTAPLLPGPMDVYWNENFLLTSQLSLTAPSGEVDLGLGVDQAVKVVRNTNYREDTAGLMGGSLQLTHKISIEIANTSARKIVLHVQERIPVASSDADDIKVIVKNSSPEWMKYEPEPESANIDALQGGYQWRLAMDAGERKELSASYEIRMPSKFELRGGNRREW